MAGRGMENTGASRTPFALLLQSQMLPYEREDWEALENRRWTNCCFLQIPGQLVFLADTELYETREGISQQCALKSSCLFDSVHFPLCNKNVLC